MASGGKNRGRNEPPRPGLGREHLEGATFRFDDGGVVAWADDDPGGESQSRSNPLDERALT